MIDSNVTKKMLIKKCHQLKITKEGVYTKHHNEESFSSWRGRSETEGLHLEPFLPLLHHNYFEPNYIEVKMLTVERLKRLSSSFSEKVVENMLKDYLEWSTPFSSLVVNPIIVTKPPQNLFVAKSKKTAKISAHSKLKRKITKTNNSSQESQQLYVVSDITGRRFNVEKNYYEYHTSWVGFPKKTWEPKTCFCEEDGSRTDIFLEYEEKHPVRQVKVPIKLEPQLSSQNNEIGKIKNPSSQSKF